jgi:hypothetical protein
MLFNADRQTKDQLRNIYKQELESQLKRKQDEKTRVMQEERQHLQLLEQRYQDDNRKKHMDKLKRISDSMGEYNQIVKDKEANKFFTKHKEVNFNTYAIKNVNNANNNNNINNANSNPPSEIGINNNNLEAEYTGERRNNAEQDFINGQKLEQQKMYRNFLDGQVITY